MLERRSLLFGVVHLKPLPGSPGYDGKGLAPIIDAAVRDSARLVDAGFDGYVLENFGDAPFFKDEVPRHVLTAMTRVALSLPGESLLRGINVLRNDVVGALSVAATVGWDFVRVNVHVGAAVTDQGVVEGRAAETLRYREMIAPGVAILADVDVKHARPLGDGFDLEEVARETAYRGRADGVIVTGAATGAPTDMRDLQRVTAAVPDVPVWVGSGATAEQVNDILKYATGVIVGTALKEGGDVLSPISAERARAFVTAARS